MFFLPPRVVFSFINYLFLLDRLPSDFIASTFPCLFLKGEVLCCLFNIHCLWDYFWAQNAKLFLRLHFHFQCFITSWVELHCTLTEAYITCGNVLVCCIVLHLVEGASSSILPLIPHPHTLSGRRRGKKREEETQ